MVVKKNKDQEQNGNSCEETDALRVPVTTDPSDPINYDSFLFCRDGMFERLEHD